MKCEMCDSDPCLYLCPELIERLGYQDPQADPLDIWVKARYGGTIQTPLGVYEIVYVGGTEARVKPGNIKDTTTGIPVYNCRTGVTE